MMVMVMMMMVIMTKCLVVFSLQKDKGGGSTSWHRRYHRHHRLAIISIVAEQGVLSIHQEIATAPTVFKHQMVKGASPAFGNNGDENECWEMVVGKQIPFPRDYIDDKTVPDRLKCGISLQVMEDPATVVPCGHTFDHNCLTKHQASHQQSHNTCPKCRGVIQQTLRLPDMKQLVRDTVKTRCIVAGCKSSMKISDMEEHLMKKCKHIR